MYSIKSEYFSKYSNLHNNILFTSLLCYKKIQELVGLISPETLRIGVYLSILE